MKTFQQLVADAKANIREVAPKTTHEAIARGEAVVLIDIREQNEWNLGHAPSAVHISRGVLESQIEARVPRDANVVLMCASGNRSALSAVALNEMGYAQVASMSGGFRDWVASGGEVAD